MVGVRSPELTREQLFIFALCFAASLKIAFFSSALPFFALDEELHFDTIQKFAAGYKAQPSLPGFDQRTAEIIELYHSPEFLRVAEPGKPFVPLSSWCRPSEERLPAELVYRTQAWTSRMKNVEVDAPPAYYAIQAVWYRIGRMLGATGVFLLYWLRFLNAIGYGFFVLFSWMFVRECYPDNAFLQFAVPIFLFVFPQDCFLLLIPTSLCATFMSLTLWLLAKLYHGDGRIWLFLVTGLAAACTALLGFGNFLVAVPLFITAWLLVTRAGTETRPSCIRKAVSMLAAAGVPVVVWLLHNRFVLGDWSGSRSKREYLTWTAKPLSQILHHPLFSWHGFSYFFSTLSRNFWRGEMNWGRTPRTAWIDPIYLWLSLVLCGVFLVQRFRTKSDSRQFSFGGLLSVSLVSTSVLFLAVISLPFDFGDCVYPSRAFPYFVSGRLIIGALLPFLIMFLRGLQILCGWISPKLNPLYIAIPLAALIFIVETIQFAPIFESRFSLLAFMLGRSCT